MESNKEQADRRPKTTVFMPSMPRLTKISITSFSVRIPLQSLPEIFEFGHVDDVLSIRADNILFSGLFRKHEEHVLH